MRSFILTTLVALSCSVPAPAADPGGVWTLTTSDFRSEAVSLRSLDSSGVKVVPAGQDTERVVPWEQFLQLERGGGVVAAPPAAKAGQFSLYLLGGDRIAGEPLGMKGEDILWRNPAAGELSVPLTALAAMSKSGPPSNERRAEDLVALANGDTVRGIVSGMTKEAISVKTATGDAIDVPLAAVSSVQFASAGPAGASNKARGFRVRLDDGSSLVGSDVKVAGGKLELTLAANAVRPLDLARVAAIEQVNGPVSFLTSRAPAEDVFVPYLGPAPAQAPTRVGTDVEGQSFTIGGRSYLRGIGVHSYSRLAYPLDGQYKAFRTQYGMNDSLDRGDVTVRIKLDDKVVHEQANVRPGKLWPPVVVDLGDAKQLVLEVDYGEGIHTQDRLNWIEPVLMREKPAPPPATQPATAPAAPLKPQQQPPSPADATGNQAKP